MKKKGQGALEYLLLIGGAVLVAAIVIALLTGVPSTVPNPACQAECGTYTAEAQATETPSVCTNAKPADCTTNCAWSDTLGCHHSGD